MNQRVRARGPFKALHKLDLAVSNCLLELLTDVGLVRNPFLGVIELSFPHQLAGATLFLTHRRTLTEKSALLVWRATSKWDADEGVGAP